MELKLIIVNPKVNEYILLIVPYGIETLKVFYLLILLYLLIVPYGIETLFEPDSPTPCGLLIVPYGIETADHRSNSEGD